MKNIMKVHYLMALAVVLLVFLTTNPANALQASASLNMSAPTFTLTDLDPTDGITPQITLSNKNSTAAWSWTMQPSPGSYFTKLVDYNTTNLPGWMNNYSFLSQPLTATSTGSLTYSGTGTTFGTTNVIGYDDRYALGSQCSFSTNFSLTGNTQLDIWIPASLAVDPAGSNPTPQMGAEAYARTTLTLSSLSYQQLAYDTLWLDHWTSGNLNGNLHVSFKNEDGSEYNGAMDVGASSVTMSYGSSTAVPEPASLLLLGLGLVGLAGVRRKFNK